MSLSYDLTKSTSRSAQEEWEPHTPQSEKFFEWHYVTAPMTGANGHQYLLFISNLNLGSSTYRDLLAKASGHNIPETLIPYMTVSHLSDYTDNISKSGSTFMLMPEDDVFDATSNTLQLSEHKTNFNLAFSYNDDLITLKSKTPEFECEINFSNANQVLWMQDSHKLKGIIQEGGEDDLSFYYFLPNLPFTGWLKYTDTDGTTVKTDVSGQGWVDRQWGDFSTKSWEWSSFRFADGDRVNLYSFWNGYQVGAYQTKDKKTSYFSNFAVQPTGYTKTKNGVWVAYGWNYKIPVKDSIYRVEPLDPRDTVENQNNTFYEGLGRLVDQHDKQVGWAVNESMDVRAMHNGPYDEHE